MKRSQDSGYELRASIGIGASLGSIFGALFGELFFDTTLVVLLSTFIGVVLGAAVGSRLKSQAFQFIWIEYPKEVARRLILSGILFLVPFSLFVYVIKVGATPAVKILMLFATLAGSSFLFYSMVYVISQLDDLLKKIILEAVAVGFGLSLFIFLSLGLLSLAFPFQVPSVWLIAFIIMLASMLLGRFVAAVKYR